MLTRSCLAADNFEDLFAEATDDGNGVPSRRGLASGHDDKKNAESNSIFWTDPMDNKGAISEQNKFLNVGESLDQITAWQQQLVSSPPLESSGIAESLFESLVSTFSAIHTELRQDQEFEHSNLLSELREEFRKFYVWNDTFSTQSGHLDNILKTSRNLQVTVLSLMNQWAITISKGWCFLRTYTREEAKSCSSQISF